MPPRASDNDSSYRLRLDAGELADGNKKVYLRVSSTGKSNIEEMAHTLAKNIPSSADFGTRGTDHRLKRVPQRMMGYRPSNEPFRQKHLNGVIIGERLRGPYQKWCKPRLLCRLVLLVCNAINFLSQIGECHNEISFPITAPHKSSIDEKGQLGDSTALNTARFTTSCYDKCTIDCGCSCRPKKSIVPPLRLRVDLCGPRRPSHSFIKM